MNDSLNRSLPSLATPRRVILWAILIVVFGVVSHLDPGWIAFVAALPLGLVGFWAVFMRPSGVPATSVTSTSDTSKSQTEPLNARIHEISREVERVGTALFTLGTQQRDVGNQATMITQATRTLEDFNGISDRARREAVQLSVLSRQTTSVTQSGQQALLEAIAGIKKTQEQVENVTGLLGTLARHLRRISEINTVVSEIATQSNFLALNAAIEAARAGSQGRSFATVAEEVRVLSEQARAAVAQIREVLTQIHQAMTQTVNAMEQEAQTVQTGAALATQAREAIDSLSGSLGQSADSVQKIIAAVDHQSASLEQLVKSINTVGQATMHSQAELRLVQNMAQELSHLSSELNQLARAQE
jgi:methyl-accepting chemotaxis protein